METFSVEREHPGRVGPRKLRIHHLGNHALKPAHPREMIIVSHDDFAVARHVYVEPKILDAARDCGAK